MKSVRRCLIVSCALGATILATAIRTSAQDTDTNLVVEADGIRFERIISGEALHHDPSFSPDGEWIAYVSTETKERCVWIVQPDGTERRQVTRASTGGWSGDYYPIWFPDGERIAFVSDRGGVARIWSVAVEGGEPKVITDDLGLGSVASGGFDLSPDGKTLVYAAGQDSGVGLVLQDLDGSDIRVLTYHEGTTDRLPGFSPDGQTIAFSSDRGDTTQLWTIPATGGQPHRLPNTQGCWWSSWSPDGRWIASQSNQRVFLIPTDGGEPIPVMRQKMEGWVPRWSPDGSRLAMTGSLNRSRLETLHLSTGEIVELSLTDGLDNYPLSWSPDGAQIAFQFSLHEIGVVSSTGGVVEILGGGTDESWGDINWSPDGETFTFSAAPIGPSGEVDDAAYRVWTMPVAGGDPQQITLTKGFMPHMSPDGEWIAYVTWDADSGVWLISSSGGLPRQLSLGEGTHLLAGWSEDGSELFVATYRGIDFERQTLRAVTVESGVSREIFTLDRTGPMPIISLDGEQLIYGGWGNSADQRSFLRTLSTGNERTVADHPLIMAAFSYDGKRVAYYHPFGSTDVWIVDVSALLTRQP